MARIPLFANYGDLTLEAFEKDPIVAEALAAEPTAEVIDADGVELRIAAIEEQDEAVDRALPAVAALREISFDVAPTIGTARPSDVALVRNVQESASIALGLPSDEMLRPTDRIAVGEALVVEGFKDTVVKALKKIWDIIVNTVLQLAAALEGLTRIIYSETRNFQNAVKALEKLPKGKEETITVPFKAGWRILFSNRNHVGGVDEIKKNIENYNQVMAGAARYDLTTGLGVKSFDFRLNRVDELPIDYMSFLDTLKTALENRGSVDGSDVVSRTISGKRVRYVNAAVFLKEFNAAKDNVLEAVENYLKLDIVVEDSAEEWDSDPEDYTLPTPDDFRSIKPLSLAKDMIAIVQRGRAFSKIFDRNKIRTMENLSYETLEKFDKQQYDESYKPYVEMYPKLVKRAIMLCGKEQRIENQFAYQYLRALTSFINTLVKAYNKG